MYTWTPSPGPHDGLINRVIFRSFSKFSFMRNNDARRPVTWMNNKKIAVACSNFRVVRVSVDAHVCICWCKEHWGAGGGGGGRGKGCKTCLPRMSPYSLPNISPFISWSKFFKCYWRRFCIVWSRCLGYILECLCNIVILTNQYGGISCGKKNLQGNRCNQAFF